MKQSLKNSNIGFKLREYKHRYSYKYTYDKMSSAMQRYKVCNEKKSLLQIKKEISICKNYWGCYPLHYFRYDLYKKDKQLSKQELINYIPEFFFYNIFLKYYDSQEYSILLNDKNLTEQLFRSVDIQQPETISKVIDGEIYTINMDKLSFDSFMFNLKKSKYNKVFVKPANGQGGYGIFIFHLSNGGEYSSTDGIKFTKQFLSEISKNTNFIIQGGLQQDENISKIYSNSINTFRITTENIKGNVRIVCSTLRMGKNGNEVDNSAQDGIILGINVSDGSCENYAVTEEGRKFLMHPNTRFIFKDYEIKRWKEIKEFVLKSASKLSQFTYLGWDVALTNKGPIAIEANLGFGLDHYQVALGGLRESFNIDNPQYFWKLIKMKSSI
ncbi:sugar-transfer associated ATP-grasp domain-containing protein [Clostridium novyi]